MEVDSKRTKLLEYCVPEVVSDFVRHQNRLRANTLLPCDPSSAGVRPLLYTVIVDYELWIHMSMSLG